MATEGTSTMKANPCHEFGKPLVIEDMAIDRPRAGEVKAGLAACAAAMVLVAFAGGFQVAGIQVH